MVALQHKISLQQTGNDKHSDARKHFYQPTEASTYLLFGVLARYVEHDDAVSQVTDRNTCRGTNVSYSEEAAGSHVRQAVLTFEEGVQNPLLDLGLLHHVGSRLSEDELPSSGFESVPVVFNDGRAVLHRHGTSHAEPAACSPGRRPTPSYLNVLIADHLQDPDVDVLLAYRCENGVGCAQVHQSNPD